MSNKWQTKKVPISDLSLWDENARFPDKYFGKSEIELIEYFLSKNDFEIEKFAEEVMNELDIPQLEKIVVLSKNDKQIVIEGNRRLTVYKLLANPELTSLMTIRSTFEKLNLKAKIDDSFELEVLITNDMDDGKRVIERKHLKSNNEVSWQDNERAHYKSRRGDKDRATRLRVAITKKLRECGLDETLIDQVLGKGFVTTFQRIMTSSAASDVFGYELDEDDNLTTTDTDFLRKLKVVIVNVLQKRSYDETPLNSRSLNSNPQIEGYLKGIGGDQFDSVDDEVTKRTTKNLFDEETIDLPKAGSSARSVPNSRSRKYLIPKTCVLTIYQTKINNIYCELKNNILLDESKTASPNAAGVLLRVFLETSIDWFLESNGVGVNENDTISTKIPKATNILEKVYSVDSKKLQAINKVGSSQPSTSILSITNFHQYVHSHKVQPQPTDLKIKWDELEEFFTILWQILEDKRKSKAKK